MASKKKRTDGAKAKDDSSPPTLKSTSGTPSAEGVNIEGGHIYEVTVTAAETRFINVKMGKMTATYNRRIQDGGGAREIIPCPINCIGNKYDDDAVTPTSTFLAEGTNAETDNHQCSGTRHLVTEDATYVLEPATSEGGSVEDSCAAHISTNANLSILSDTSHTTKNGAKAKDDPSSPTLKSTSGTPSGSGTDVTVSYLTNVYYVSNGAVVDRQMLPQSSTSETEQNATTRQTIASYHEEILELNKKYYKSGKEGEQIAYRCPIVNEVRDFYKGELLKKKKMQLKTEDSLIPAGETDKDSRDVESETEVETESDRDVGSVLKQEVADMYDDSDEDDSQSDLPDENYNKLLDRIMHGKEKRIALTGEAGAGKSFLLKRLAKDVTKRRYPVVFRLFSGFGIKETTPRDIFFGNPSEDSSENEKYHACYKWMLENQEDLIFFLDGLDQASWKIGDTEEDIHREGTKATPEAIMSNIFRRCLFPNAKVVYASRECSVADLDERHRPDTVFGLAGLSMKDCKYLYTTMIGEKGKEAWEKLVTQSNPIVSLLTTPALLCFAVDIYGDKDARPPRNATELMQGLLCMFTQSCHKGKIEVDKILPHLREVSYNGIKAEQVLFLGNDFYKLNEDEILFLISKIPNSRASCKMLDGDKIYYFSHQYIQEYLGAEHTILLKVSDFKAIIPVLLSLNRLSIVAKFVSGILKIGKASGTPIEALKEKRRSFKEEIARQYKNGINLLELLTILAEFDDAELIQSLVYEINLPYLSISTARMYAISQVIRHCKALREMSLKACHITDATIKILMSGPQNRKFQIPRLDISTNAAIGVIGFQNILKFAAHCKVKELNASFCELEDEHFSSVNNTEDVQKLKLKLLDLSGNYMSETSFKVIGSIIDHNSELHLVQCNITNSELEELHKALGEKRISHLDISSNATSVEGCATIGKIVNCPGIDKLVMRNCNLTSASLEAFHSKIGKAKLNYFDISWNDIGDGGAIVGKIAKQLSISTLALNNCKLSNVALDAFLQESKGAEISTLDISWNGLERKSVEIVTKIIKDCTVRHLAIRKCYLSDHSLSGLLPDQEGDEYNVSSLDISGNTINFDEVGVVGKITRQCINTEGKLIIRHCGLTKTSIYLFVEHARRLLQPQPSSDVTENDWSDSENENIEQHNIPQTIVFRP